MTRSERVYLVMLRVYPAEHHRAYGDAMAQLFRDRLRRDGGGIGTARVWASVGPDLVASAFTERLETAMNVQTWTNRWWEATVIVYAIAQVIMGVVIGLNLYPGWSILIGFGPAALLLGGLVLRERQRGLATLMIIVGSLLPWIFFWMMYPFVVAAIVIGGGLWSGKIGKSTTAEPASA